METSLLSGSVWLSLPKPTRAKIAELFGMEKSGGVEVRNGATGPQVISDGYTYRDLSTITVEKMQTILSSEDENFYSLFKKIVALVNEEEIVEEMANIVIDEVRLAGAVDFGEQSSEELTPGKNRFCEFCDSKGVRHKKNCTRPITE